MKMLIDSGATSNIILCTFRCEIRISNRTEQAEFIVIKGKGEPLFGKETATKMCFENRCRYRSCDSYQKSLQKQYPEVFQGVGRLKDRQITRGTTT